MRKLFPVGALLLASVWPFSDGSVAQNRDSSRDHPFLIESSPDPEIALDLVADIELAVTLRARFTKSGNVTDIKVISSRVPASLSADLVEKLEQATVAAAKKIRFTPATKNGHRISQRVQLEYTFRRLNRKRYSIWQPTLIAD